MSLAENIGGEQAKERISFTCFTKDDGILTKRMKLADGQLVKDTSECRMSKGQAQTVTLTPAEFGAFLQGLKQNQAIAHGICGHSKVEIVSKSRETGAKSRGGLPVIARSKEHFRYPEGPGLLMLDHDKARDNAVSLDAKALTAYSPDKLAEIISNFFPEIKQAAYVSSCSTSSCIHNTETNEELRGKGAGFHLYLFPNNAADVPRFLAVLGKRLVLAGYGRVEISRAGSLLERTLADLLVGSPERLDFVAGAVCDKGLEQRRPEPEQHPGGLLDTAKLPDLSTEEEAAYQEIIRQLKEQAQPKQETVKAAYVEQEAEKLASGSGGTISLEQARETVKTRQSHVLADADLLLFGHLKEPVSVAHALDNGPAFDGRACADPLEPEYNSSRSTAKFYWNDGKPIVRSHAHGGIQYTFSRFSAEEPVDFEAAAAELVERTKADCGAPFAADALKMLTKLRTADKARFMRVRQELKTANNAVVLSELDRDICSLSRVRNSFNPSHPSLPSLSTAYPFTDPSRQENILHFQDVLVSEDDKGKHDLVQESVAAALLSASLQGQYAFSDSGLCWHQFDGSCWRKCGAMDFDRILTALLYAGCGFLGFSSNYQTGVKKVLQSCGRNLLPAPLPGSIPFKNGLLLHKSKELLPVTPENAHTWVLPYEYTAEAECPEFLKWLKTALDGDADSVWLIQAWFNALLTGRPDLQVFLHLIGPAGTGKSTLGRLAFILVGKDNAITTKLKELESNRFETAGIYGRRLVAIEEADKYGGAVSVLKAMTGQDPLRLERKNQQQEGSFIYEGQTLMMSNERLATTDYTSGIERRRMTVELTKRITKEERAEWSKRGGEETILHAEAAGIINWAVQLSREEVTDIFKTMPERVRLANLDAAMFNNPLMEWMLDTLRPEPGAVVQVGDKKEFRGNQGEILFEYANERLYPNYLRWCRENGRESLSSRRFSESLLDAAQTQGAQVEKQRRNNGTFVCGLRFRAEFEKSWLEILQTSGGEGLGEESVKGQCRINPLIMQEVKDVKDVSTLPVGENGYIPLPDETVEVEF
ncbi:MAG: DNA primase family protein [Candidatus Electronema sp. V4]|uniref:DNA primase family protein n=1 Tax=Candidatus Electronema sp. V4 TaxID=3454756 RepID=UPI00405573E7